MTARPPIALSRLRDIGWREWDPIGLLAAGEGWHRQPFADEYDAHLLRVAGALRRGGSPQSAIGYLLAIERDHMGLGARPGQEARAEATVHAIQRHAAGLEGPHAAPA